MKRPSAKRIAPLAVVATGLLVAALLVTARARVETRPAEITARLVRATSVLPQKLVLYVFAQGSVEPQTETDLVAEVAGRVIEVSPAFAPGGFFDADEVLLRLDPRDQELALMRASARFDAARSRLKLAERSHERNQELEKIGALSAREFDAVRGETALARASYAEALAAKIQAERDLERTQIRAPYAGRVRRADADIGQFVSRGTALGGIYATDYAEIPLPIPDTELAYLDLDLGYSGGPSVELSTTFAGRAVRWSGRIVRTEGEIDPRTRMVRIIARVEDPYGRHDNVDHPPLAVGMFVDAKIQGRTIEAAVELPRSALREGDRVLIIDGNDKLRVRDVEVLRRTRSGVLISSGLKAGERVCVSRLDTLTAGTRVRTPDPA
ncbi:MAG: efflux RND transporter periplasmic adaptor subunit [bacterium]